MRLINEKTGKAVSQGAKLQTFRGETVTLTDWREPHKVGSTGRVYVTDEDGFSREYFPSVVGLVWEVV